MIRQRYREEFEGAGIHQVRKMIEHGNYADDEKRRHAQLWIDEQERGEDRVYRAEQLRLQRRGDLKTTVALILSGIAIVVSIWAKYSHS